VRIVSRWRIGAGTWTAAESGQPAAWITAPRQVGTVDGPRRDLPNWIASSMRIIGAADGRSIAAVITTRVARTIARTIARSSRLATSV
jgi:hypothetical protein